MLGVRKSRTSPYHPQGDPQPERFNRTLLNMLGTLEPSQKSKWSQHIAHLVHAYNCTPNEATGYSPYFLIFGREARLPVDVCFGVSADGTSTTSHLQYVSKMKKELQAAYQLAQATSAKMNQSNKERYDQRVRYHCLKPGDRVLIRNLGLKGKQKLADRWSANPYVVESQMSDLPVYRLKPADGLGPIKVMHRNHILPLGQEVQLSTEFDPKPTPSPRALRRRKAKERNQTPEVHKDDSAADVPLGDQNSSDSESEYGHYPEDLIIDNPEEICEQPEQDVMPTESNPPTNATEVPEVAASSESLGGLPVVIEEVVTGQREVEQESSVEGTYTTDTSNIANPEPEIRRSQRERKPADRLHYTKLGEPCAKSVVVGNTRVHSATPPTMHFPEHCNSCHAWWCNSFAQCLSCMNKVPLFSPPIIPVITL